MWDRLRKLREQRNKISADMQALNTLAETEERGFTSDEHERWAKMTADVNDLREQEERVQQMIDAGSGLDEIVNALPNESRSGSDEPENRGGEQPSAADQYASAFGALIRSSEPGLTGLTAEQRSLIQRSMVHDQELRAQGVATGGAGAFTVAEGFGDRMIDTMLAFGGIMGGGATIIDTENGAPLPFAANNDTGNAGALLAENTQDSEQDLTFTQRQLDAYMYTSNVVRVSLQLMQDSFFDMEGYLSGKLGERIGRAVAPHFATGTGSGQPNGLMTAAGTGHDAAAAAALTFDDVLELEHSVDPAYRALGASFVFNDNTLKALQGTNDSEGRPLWLPRVGDSVPETIYGYPYVIDQGLADIGASAASMGFGRLSEYYIRRVQPITLLRLVERYADFLQVGFLAFARFDGELMDTSAFKKLVHPAS